MQRLNATLDPNVGQGQAITVWRIGIEREKSSEINIGFVEQQIRPVKQHMMKFVGQCNIFNVNIGIYEDEKAPTEGAACPFEQCGIGI